MITEYLNKLLNTNTRYLHESIINYAQNISAMLPENLEVCFFTNSGSESNDLALRIARQYSGSFESIVIEGAYHGHTQALIDVSPYKFNGKGGSGKKNHVHVLEMPDGIRGKWTYKDKDWSQKYINDAIIKIKKIFPNKFIQKIGLYPGDSALLL